MADPEKNTPAPTVVVDGVHVTYTVNGGGTGGR
ncbi:ABC transporter ATP-binding protein, partial [Streptomyces sp. SID6041]|nr:ABC transporter ATP-binding protein [Streptomyces sp. SID6041]